MNEVERLVGFALTATAEQRIAGRLWYDEARKAAAEIGGILGVNIRQSAGVLAAISPQLEAGDNFHESVIEIISGKRQRVNGRQLDKARAIIRGADPEMVLVRETSPKTNSFYRNILGDPFVITVDGRIADLVVDKVRPWKDNRGIDTRKGYERMEGILFDATRELHRYGRFEGLPGYCVQAILWLVAKDWELHGLTSRGLPRKQGPPRRGQTYTSLMEGTQ